MKLEEYNKILVILVASPLALVLLVILCLLCWSTKREAFVLLTLNGVVVKRKIDGDSELLFCGRKIEKGYHCCCGIEMIKGLLVVAAYVMVVTLQTILVVFTFQLTYDCVDDDNVDCFKRHYGTDIELFPSKSPLNCSSISSTQPVFCYRSVILDPENWFKTFTAAYILVRMLRFVLYLVAALLMWSGDKSKGLQMFFRLVICVVIGGLIASLIFFSVFYKRFEYAARQLSLSEVMQIVSIMILPPLFTLVIPWGDFAEKDYFIVQASVDHLLREGAEIHNIVMENTMASPL